MSPQLTFETLLYDKKDAIAYVTVNRPKVMNALNRTTWEELKRAFEDAREDPQIRGDPDRCWRQSLYCGCRYW